MGTLFVHVYTILIIAGLTWSVVEGAQPGSTGEDGSIAGRVVFNAQDRVLTGIEGYPHQQIISDSYSLDSDDAYELAATVPECIDTEPLNDGWGWDGVKPYRTEQIAQEGDCIDTDPVGDGWGWNGVASCRIVDNECVDTEPLNDGWGWNGTRSCRTERPAQAGGCVDTDPVADGWGWDGVKSCRISSGEIVNLASGALVNTTSLYWMQSDLMDSSLLCKAFVWSIDDNEYVATGPDHLTQYDHYSDGTGKVLLLNEGGGTINEIFSWSVTDGVYSGTAPIAGFNTVEDKPRGFNVWQDSTRYSQCTGIHSSSESLESCRYSASDNDGDGYGWEDSTSCRVTADSEPVSEIYDAVSNEQVDLVNLQWRPQDLDMRAINCTQYNYSDGEYIADDRLRIYAHDAEFGQVTEYWIIFPHEMRGLRQLPDGSVIPLGFSAVKSVTEDRTIAHFKIDNLPATVPYTELHIGLSNIDAGAAGGTFDVYAFTGDGVVSTDEWDAGVLHTSFYDIENPGTLTLNVTALLQDAVDREDTYLSVRFTGGTGADRYNLDEAATFLYWYPNGHTISYWLDGGIYNGAAPIDAYGELVWQLIDEFESREAGFRSWTNDNTYTECLGAQPGGNQE